MADQSSKVFQSKMNDLSPVVSNLMVDIHSENRFFDPKNKKDIEQNLKNLADLATEIKSQFFSDNTKSLSLSSGVKVDVGLSFIADFFQEDTRVVYQEFKKNNLLYARNLARGITGYCIGCHSRGSFGPSFKKISETKNLQKLNSLERADFFAATRFFDEALVEYEKFIGLGTNLSLKAVEWERAVRTAIALSVRVKNDPDLTLRLIDSVLVNQSAPRFLIDDVKAWKVDVLAWKDRFKIKTDHTEDALFEAGKTLFTQAIAKQKYPMDRSSMISFLRASAAYHDFLSGFPQSKKTAEVLYFLGISYQVLQDLRIWNLHNYFFKSCIRKAPGTDISKNCFRSLEESVYLGFSGSGGVSIPKDVQDGLKDLEVMAFGKTVKEVKETIK